MLKLLTLWRIISHNGSLDDKLIHEGIERLKIWVNLRIYQRMNETFFVTKSFNWRLPLPSGSMLFSFEIGIHSCFLRSSQISLFSLLQLWSSLKFKSKNQGKITGKIYFSFVYGHLACLYVPRSNNSKAEDSNYWFIHS